MNIKIEHEKKYQQFTIVMGEDEAELAYATPSEGVIDFTHTYVPEKARGQGIADKLIQEGLAYALQQECKVVASCPVVAKFIKRHEEYQKLLQ